MLLRRCRILHRPRRQTAKRWPTFYFEDKSERRSAAKLLTKDEARPIAANSALPLRTPQLPLVAPLIGAVLRLPADADVL